MKALAKTVVAMAVATALALLINCETVYASHDKQNSPELGHEVDMIFSVVRDINQPGVDETTNGIEFDGQPIAEYYQIHEDVTQSGEDGNRFAIKVSDTEVATRIRESLNSKDAKNLNEFPIGNPVSSAVEEVLSTVLTPETLAEVNNLAANYMVYVWNNTGFNLENYNKTWFINWYVIKYQADRHEVGGRIHIDGVRVTFKPNYSVRYYDVTNNGRVEFKNLAYEAETEFGAEINITKYDVATTDELRGYYYVSTDADFHKTITEKNNYYEIYLAKESSNNYEPTPEPTPIITPMPTPVPTPEIIEEDIPEIEDEDEELEEIEEVEDDEEEEVNLDDLEVPEGAPEEDIDVDLPNTPEELPQTGTASNALFYSIGGMLMMLGVVIIQKIK